MSAAAAGRRAGWGAHGRQGWSPVSSSREPENLLNASPATVSRAGIIYVSDSVLGWAPPVQTWLDGRREGERNILKPLFDNIAGPMLEFVKINLKTMMFVPEVAAMQSMCTLLAAVLQ